MAVEIYQMDPRRLIHRYEAGNHITTQSRATRTIEVERREPDDAAGLDGLDKVTQIATVVLEAGWAAEVTDHKPGDFRNWVLGPAGRLTPTVTTPAWSAMTARWEEAKSKAVLLRRFPTRASCSTVKGSLDHHC